MSAFLDNFGVLWAWEKVGQVHGTVLADESSLENCGRWKILLLDGVFVGVVRVDGVVA